MAAVQESLPNELQLAVDAHVKYIQSLDTQKDDFNYWLTEHLRLNGVYWGLTALHLLGRPDALPRAETIDFVLSCQHDNGGFGAAPGHDAHMLSTVSAVQILVMIDALDDLEKRGKGIAKIGKCMSEYSEKVSHLSRAIAKGPLTCLQSLPIYKTARRELLLGMNGERKIHAFYTAL